MSRTPPLTFAIPSDRMNTVILKDARGNIVMELRSLPGDAVQVRTFPRPESTTLLVRPESANKVVIFAKDIDSGEL
jgi:hypothetical protein